MKGKTCVITGATSGIGRAAALEFGRLGANLILTGRNEPLGEKLIRRLERVKGHGSAHFLAADLSNRNDVRRLAVDIAKQTDRIDVLINNAGGRFNDFRLSEDGVELTFATNHLGHFLLTALLLEILHTAEAARIIVVSSGAHSGSTGDFERYLLADNYDRKAAYGTSKLANLMFTYELARRLRRTKITCNAVDPGGVATNLGRNNGIVSWMRHIGYYALKRDLITPKNGAKTIVYLASSPAVDGVSGKYFFRNRETTSSPVSHDAEITKRLWNLSIDMTGVNERIGPTWEFVKPSDHQGL